MVFGVLGIFGLVGLAWSSYHGHVPLEVLTLSKYDAVTSVACGSDSMGLSFRCGDQLLLREVDRGTNLTPGNVYTYNDGNLSVLHRYLGCVDTACTILFFRGDNNKIGEKVNRENVTYELVGVYYE